MVKQEIQFEHDPARVRWASLQLALSRLKEPRGLLLVAALIVTFVVGLLTSNAVLMGVTLGGFVVGLAFVLRYALTSPRSFCGVKIGLSIQDDGMHFTSPQRSGFVGWAGFRRIYQLKDMWALFLHRSESVTLIPVDQLDHDTLEFIRGKLQENNVRISGTAG